MIRAYNCNITPGFAPTMCAYLNWGLKLYLPVTLNYDPANPARCQVTFALDETATGGGTLAVQGTGAALLDVPMAVPDQSADGVEWLGAPLELVAGGVDPFKVPTAALRAFRGAIFTARVNVPWGPRPGQESNINAMDEILCYSPADQAKMIAAYRPLHPTYRHCTFTPGPPSHGYHGDYGLQPDLRLTIPEHKKLLQTWWNAGLYPVLFCLNADDGYPLTIDGTDALDSDFGDAYRALGGLIQIVVPGGWEPGGYNVSNAEWVYRFQWAKRTFPNARVFGLHMYADFDAPIGGQDGVPPRDMTKQEAWSNVAAAGMTTFLDQVGGYVEGRSEIPTAVFLENFAERISSFKRRFAQWGLGVDYIAAEFAAYVDYHDNFAEVYARQIGDAAMAAGADGYFDGGTV